MSTDASVQPVISDGETHDVSVGKGNVIVRGMRALSTELAENLQSTAETERLWLIGRMVVAAVGVVASLSVLEGTPSAPFIYAGAVIILVSNLFLLHLLRKGKTTHAAIGALITDNLTLLAVWTGSLSRADDTARQANDLYLAFFPVLTLWSSRVGFKLGIPYVAIWMGWISWTVYAFLPAGGYEVQQLPIRIAYLSLSSILGMWTARLISAQKRLAAESTTQAEVLMELDRAKDQFIATVSHELKTPMAAVLGFTRLLKDDVESNTRHERLKIVERNGERLSLLIDDLLDLSRIQNQTLSLNRSSVEVCQLLKNTVDDLSEFTSQRSQRIELDISHGHCWLQADQSRLAQVMSNLLTNASKYSPEHSLIKVTSRLTDGSLSISVVDQGDGISEEDQESIFEPFFRTHAARRSKTPGTGLGLFITKQIVELHDGRLELKSRAGHGTAVSVHFTVVQSERPAEPGTLVKFKNAFEDLDSAPLR